MNKIVETLNSNGVVLIPTDTTFGLSVLPNPEAIQKLNEVKRRDANKHYLLLVNSNRQLQDLVDVPDLAWDLIDLSEKPLTLVYDQIVNVPDFLLSNDKTIAIRLVKDRYLTQLINRVKSPLISTSANISGQNNPMSFDQIATEIIESVDAIADEARDFNAHFPASSIIQLGADSQVKVIRP